MKILIVEDEALARERLKSLLTELDASDEILEASNGMEALEKINQYTPEIVLLDIRMPGMDGLEVAHHLKSQHENISIIFTTAYQDHALEAFDLHAIDYLLKPVRKSRLNDALKRAQLIQQSVIESVRKKDRSATRSHISVLEKGKLILIPVNEIYYLKADEKYVEVVWSGGRQLMNESLKALETEFHDLFLRIHRNALVANNRIASMEKNKEGATLITLQDIPDTLQVSRRHLSQVRKTFKQYKPGNPE